MKLRSKRHLKHQKLSNTRTLEFQANYFNNSSTIDYQKSTDIFRVTSSVSPRPRFINDHSRVVADPFDDSWTSSRSTSRSGLSNGGSNFNSQVYNMDIIEMSSCSSYSINNQDENISEYGDLYSDKFLASSQLEYDLQKQQVNGGNLSSLELFYLQHKIIDDEYKSTIATNTNNKNNSNGKKKRISNLISNSNVIGRNLKKYKAKKLRDKKLDALYTKNRLTDISDEEYLC